LSLSKKSIFGRVKRIVAAARRGQKRSLDEQLQMMHIALKKFKEFERSRNFTEATKWHNVIRKTLQAVHSKPNKVQLSRENQVLIKQAQNIRDAKPTRTASKKKVLKELSRWTTPYYSTIQNHKRGTFVPLGPNRATNVWKRNKLLFALNSYFTRYALKAPSMPPGQFVNGRQKYLFRGLYKDGEYDLEKVLRDGYIEDRGYIAFSRDRELAEYYSQAGWRGSKRKDGIVILVDPFTDIPRGTPWLWFDKRTQNSYVMSHVPDEAEVLLPPGRLVFYDPSAWVGGRKGIRARYIPAHPIASTSLKRTTSTGSNSSARSKRLKP